MSANHDGASALTDTRDSRRWLIGIGISVAFGLFGAVMALLSYADRIRPSGAPKMNAPANRASDPASSQRHRKSSERHNSERHK